MSVALLNGAKQGKEKGGRYIPSADVVERCVKKLRRREREEKFTNERIMLLNFLAHSPIFSKRNWGAEGVISTINKTEKPQKREGAPRGKGHKNAPTSGEEEERGMRKRIRKKET